jgi:hypothetical protein
MTKQLDVHTKILNLALKPSMDKIFFNYPNCPDPPVQPTQPHYSTGTAGSFCSGKAAGA